jgi:hypothetical protein
VADAVHIPLTYHGTLAHRGVSISRDTYRKTWTFRLADGVWRLIDPTGEVVHTFTQKYLHTIVVLPGTMRGYPDLYFFGLGRPIHCFLPEPEVVAALKPHVEQSERANAPRLAKWYRGLGLGFLGVGTLGLAVCVAALSWALWGDHTSGDVRFSGALLLVPAFLLGGGCFIVGGVRDLLKAKHFAGSQRRESDGIRNSSNAHRDPHP